MDHITDFALGGSDLFSTIRPLAQSDRGYLVQKWIEEHHFSSKALSRLPFAMYRATVGEQIKSIVNAASTRMLGSYSDDGRVLGWLAYTPGRHIAAVHFAYTRRKLGADERVRRRGVMAGLIDAADLGRNFVYTHRGAMKRHGTGVAGVYRVTPPSVDLLLVDWLRQRGVSAVYMPLDEWRA